MGRWETESSGGRGRGRGRVYSQPRRHRRYRFTDTRLWRFCCFSCLPPRRRSRHCTQLLDMFAGLALRHTRQTQPLRRKRVPVRDTVTRRRSTSVTYLVLGSSRANVIRWHATANSSPTESSSAPLHARATTSPWAALKGTPSGSPLRLINSGVAFGAVGRRKKSRAKSEIMSVYFMMYWLRTISPSEKKALLRTVEHNNNTSYDRAHKVKIPRRDVPIIAHEASCHIYVATACRRTSNKAGIISFFGPHVDSVTSTTPTTLKALHFFAELRDSQVLREVLSLSHPRRPMSRILTSCSLRCCCCTFARASSLALDVVPPQTKRPLQT